MASVRPADIHRLSLDLQKSWNQLFILLRNGGEPSKPSLSPPKQIAINSAEADFLSKLASKINSLYTLNYSSLSSNKSAQPKVSAKKYIAECDSTLHLVQQGIKGKHPVVTKQLILQEHEKVEHHLANLRWQVEKLELSPTATLADVAHAVRPQIAIPGLGSVPMAIGVAFSIIALLCVYFYLISLLRALRESIEQERFSEINNWLFLHPGWMGPLLGMFWLTMPIISLHLAGQTIFSVQAVNTVNPYAVYAAPLLPLAWLWSLISAFRVRKAALKKDEQFDTRVEKFAFPAVPLSRTHRAA